MTTLNDLRLRLNHHNGAGEWPIEYDDRWRDQFGHLVKPWRDYPDNGHILVLPQRGIGPPGVAMPRDWPLKIMKRLQSTLTDRQIRLRKHPGGNKTPKPLEADLEGAYACVTWGSGAAVKALIAGVPVFYEMPGWIGRDAARYGITNINDLYTGDRTHFFRRLSYAQWLPEEIASGVPFKRLLECV